MLDYKERGKGGREKFTKLYKLISSLIGLHEHTFIAFGAFIILVTLTLVGWWCGLFLEGALPEVLPP